MTSSIQDRFQSLQQNGGKAFMPFVTAGDPDLEFTEEVIRALDKAGCSFCEVGIPYSDPIADGPVIQASYTRALEKGISVEQIFSMLSRVSGEVSMPIVVMVSYAIVFRRGVDRFLTEAKAAGVAGAIIPDLLIDDAELLAPKFAEHDFCLIQLVTPTTSRERALRIAKTSTGFVYYVSVTGITGERTELPPQLVEDVSWLREQIDVPLCIGFGISNPEHASLLAPVSDGLIVGSAIVRRIQQATGSNRSEVLNEVSNYVQELMSAIPAEA